MRYLVTTQTNPVRYMSMYTPSTGYFIGNYMYLKYSGCLS